MSESATIPVRKTHPLVDGYPPPWACGWGQDRFGVFADLRVGHVRQRCRWIPPGSFWMGSPEDEAGRWDYEGPRHHVTLTQGFWLADTPCTQEMWREVMGKAPSHFRGHLRPVESVSWKDCRDFCRRLGERLPGAAPSLPTEAQWEYACRAGKEAATWLGELALDQEGIGDYSGILDTIAWYTGAWYRGNVGDRGSTREVATKAANPWGLYDMLGNVDEWTASWLHAYGDEPRVDPLDDEESAVRVIRGGAWSSFAHEVRAAFRRQARPGNRNRHLGFRFSPGQGSGAEPRESRRAAPGGAERGTSRRARTA